ncbi:MAG: hypothetical protein DLM50_06110 [Candidatus Meridianibacter frigidus]|nr:MAG: hypothetical protein DLM50_06110 [Candidatus Eremiobacteraeota bacterium]
MAVQTPESVPERGNGLQTALNVIVAPRDAFETLRIIPMWGWAFLIAMVLFIVGTLLAAPAQQHAMHSVMVHQMAADPNSAQLTDAQREQRIATIEKFSKFGVLIVPIAFLIISAILTGILLVFNVIGRGTASFKQLWCAIINLSTIVALATLVVGVLAMMKGPDAFNTTIDQYLVMPSAAWLAPSAAPKLQALLSQINPFTIWNFILTAMMMTIIARVSKGIAYSGAFTLWLIGALLTTLGAR